MNRFLSAFQVYNDRQSKLDSLLFFITYKDNYQYNY